MTIDLKAIRGRAAEGVASHVSESPMAADRAIEQLEDDRAQLLALGDRMRPYLQHDRAKLCSKETYRDWPCRCGLDDLLRDLDGDARGGGR